MARPARGGGGSGAGDAAGAAAPAGGDFPLGFLWKTHDYVNNHIRFADAKASLIIGISSALLASLFATHAHHYLNPARFTLVDWTWKATFLGFKALMAFSLLSAAVVVSVLAISPRLWEHPQRDAPRKPLPLRIYERLSREPPRGFIFWRSVIAHGSSDEFWRQLSQQTEIQLTEHLAKHLFILSEVADAKFRFVHWGIFLGFLGGLFACAFILGSS